MGVLLAPALGLIKGMGAYAAAHPIAAGAATGALSGGIQDGWEGALRGAALGGVTAGAGGMLGRALSRIGAPAAMTSGLTAGARDLLSGASQAASGLSDLGGAVGAAAAAPAVDELVVTGARPNNLSPDALGSGATQLADASPQEEGNSWGRPLGNKLVQTAVSQAMARGPNMASPPTAGIIGNANPFAGASSAATPAGLAIKGSTAPDVYPWKRAAA
jgi:hypothetical protein